MSKVLVTGGTGSAIVRTPLEDTTLVENQDALEQVDDAINYALETMDDINRLSDMVNKDNHTEEELILLNAATEALIEKHDIPSYALEDNEDSIGQKEEVSKLKKVILYLFAIVERMFRALFDFFRNQKLVARKLLPLTKVYIGEADSLSASIANQLRIKDRSLMVALHSEGIAPRKAPEAFEVVKENFLKHYRHSPVTEVLHLVEAAKAEKPEAVLKCANDLRDKLEAGLKETMEVVNPETLPFFSDKKAEGITYYVSKSSFGENYIFGYISDTVDDKGHFTYRCGIRRDPEVPLRVGAFPVLNPDEIRHICRTARDICEDIIRFSREEELMQRVLREAQFLTRKTPDKNAVVALKDISDVGQSTYVVNLRHAVRVMQSLMRWCNLSILKYQEVKE